jgi:hypothetical protein
MENCNISCINNLHLLTDRVKEYSEFFTKSSEGQETKYYDLEWKSKNLMLRQSTVSSGLGLNNNRGSTTPSLGHPDIPNNSKSTENNFIGSIPTDPRQFYGIELLIKIYICLPEHLNVNAPLISTQT